jgi:hypothetical protein
LKPRVYYPHKYKHDKQEDILPFQTIKQKVVDTNLSISEEAFFWLLYYCGVRKSEGYERVLEDFKVNDTHLIVDFHKRKKGGAEVPPLKLPLRWYGVDKIVECVRLASVRRPIEKAVYVYVDKKRTKTLKMGKWVFPRIQSTKAWEIVRKILGEGFYPHFLRLNRLSEIGSDPTANLIRLKSFSGIKFAKSLSAYLGKSEEEQDKALEYMDKKFS